MSASKTLQRSSFNELALWGIVQPGGFSPGIDGGQYARGLASRHDALAALKSSSARAYVPLPVSAFFGS
jgi:hypothetical protein